MNYGWRGPILGKRNVLSTVREIVKNIVNTMRSDLRVDEEVRREERHAIDGEAAVEDGIFKLGDDDALAGEERVDARSERQRGEVLVGEATGSDVVTEGEGIEGAME